MRKILGLSCMALFFLSIMAHSDVPLMKRKEVQAFIKAMVKKYHFDEKELTQH